MGFSRFPRKNKSIGLRCRPPHARFMYPLALVSGAPHKAYIFRFNTPTNNTFPESGTHTCLILRGYPPSSHTFLAKSEGVNPPLCSYIIRNVGSTPLLLNQLGSGICAVIETSIVSVLLLAPSIHAKKLKRTHSYMHQSL